MKVKSLLFVLVTLITSLAFSSSPDLTPPSPLTLDIDFLEKIENIEADLQIDEKLWEEAVIVLLSASPAVVAALPSIKTAQTRELLPLFSNPGLSTAVSAISNVTLNLIMMRKIGKELKHFLVAREKGDAISCKNLAILVVAMASALSDMGFQLATNPDNNVLPYLVLVAATAGSILGARFSIEVFSALFLKTQQSLAACKKRFQDIDSDDEEEPSEIFNPLIYSPNISKEYATRLKAWANEISNIPADQVQGILRDFRASRIDGDFAKLRKNLFSADSELNVILDSNKTYKKQLSIIQKGSKATVLAINIAGNYLLFSGLFKLALEAQHDLLKIPPENRFGQALIIAISASKFFLSMLLANKIGDNVSNWDPDSIITSRQMLGVALTISIIFISYWATVPALSIAELSNPEIDQNLFQQILVILASMTFNGYSLYEISVLMQNKGIDWEEEKVRYTNYLRALASIIPKMRNNDFARTAGWEPAPEI